MFDLIIKNGTCLLSSPNHPNKVIEEQTDIAIKDGYIQEIGSFPEAKALRTLSYPHLHILPGLIDSQVHFREPGLEYKEDIEHGSLSAIKGGITAVFEMPNTNPATMTKEALDQKINIAKQKSHCDFAFYLGAGKGNASQLNQIENTPYCCGVKVFLGNSTGNLAVDDEETLNIILKNRNRMTAIHSEDEKRLVSRKHLSEQKPPRAHNHPIWRDPESALISTKRIVALARKYNKPLHILHISTKEEIDFLKDHKDLISIEVTPQHLTLAAPDCYDRYGSYVQMNPPIRDKYHQKALWKAIETGLVDIIGSDHAPHTKEEKEKPYPQSPSGMPGTQTLLPLMLNHIHHKRLDLKTLVNLLAHNPAQRFKIKNQGKIKVGYKAHFTIVDLKAKRTIESKWLSSKCSWSPYEGWSVRGWPMATILYGQEVVREDEILSKDFLGQGIEFFRCFYLKSLQKISIIKYMKLLFVLLLLVSVKTYGATSSDTESGYKYVLKNYFSKRRPNFFSHKGAPRNLTLYMGSSLYRETKDEVLFPISSFIFGFNQRIKEIPTVGDLNLQIGIQSIKLETHRGTVIEITPRFTLPDIRSGFPFYVGIGAGLGFFPRHIVKNLPALSFNAQVFTGMRFLDLYYNLGLTGEFSLKMQVPFQDLKLYLELFGSLGFVFSF